MCCLVLLRLLGVLSGGGDRWTVKLDVRDLGGCAVWSRKQPLASSGAVLGLLDGPHGCDPSFLYSLVPVPGFFVGTCLLGRRECPGCIGFLTLFVMAVPVMFLFML